MVIDTGSKDATEKKRMHSNHSNNKTSKCTFIDDVIYRCICIYKMHVHTGASFFSKSIFHSVQYCALFCNQC